MRQTRRKQTNPKVCYWTSLLTRVLVVVLNPTNPSNQLLITTTLTTIQLSLKINPKNQSTIITNSAISTNHHQTPPVSVLLPILQLQVNKPHHLQSPLLKIKPLQIYTRINPNHKKKKQEQECSKRKKPILLKKSKSKPS